MRYYSKQNKIKERERKLERERTPQRSQNPTCTWELDPSSLHKPTPSFPPFSFSLNQSLSPSLKIREQINLKADSFRCRESLSPSSAHRNRETSSNNNNKSQGEAYDLVIMVEAKDQDMGDGMQCINHPFTKNPGGICAFCLQEKLGKLVTSSFPLPKHLSSSSTTSSSPSFRSDSVGSTTTTVSAANLSASLSLSVSRPRNITPSNNNNSNNKLPFLLAKKKNKMLTASTSASSTTENIVFKRSQSTTTATYGGSDFSPRKRSGFWSFLHLHSYKHHNSSKKVGNFHDSSKTTTRPQPTKHTENGLSKTETTTVGSSSSSSSSSSMSKRVNGGGSSKRNGIDVIIEEDGSPNIVVTAAAATVTPSERKVSRSRSVGCGSRSFSGDFFERITNGFGDCTLRRVESQREGSNKGKVSSNNGGVREMVRCGGIFGGFMIMTSSSSSSSSSSWVSSSSTEQHHQNNMAAHGGRNRSWGWAFASPMRAFGSSSGKRGRTISDSTNKNTTPNLGAIPSLLAARS